MQEVLQHLGCLDHPDEPRGYSYNREHFLGRCVGKDTSQARGRSRDDRSCLPVQSPDSAMEQGDLLFYRGFIKEVPGGEIVHSIHNSIRTAYKPFDIGLIDGCVDRPYRNAGIERGQFLFC